MTDDRKSGISLIAGILGFIITMAIHPQGDATLTAAEYAHLATASAIAHTLALVSLVMLSLGALGLTRRLASYENQLRPTQPDRLSIAAFVTYAFAAIAIMIAAAVSGFIVPRIYVMMVRDVPAAAAQWRISAAAAFQFNQAFARIYTVATSAAIILWSTSALRNGGLGRKLSFYGCISSVLITLLIFVGHIRLDVHGMTAVVIVQAAWFLIAARQLLIPTTPAA